MRDDGKLPPLGLVGANQVPGSWTTGKKGQTTIGKKTEIRKAREHKKRINVDNTFVSSKFKTIFHTSSQCSYLWRGLEASSAPANHRPPTLVSFNAQSGSKKNDGNGYDEALDTDCLTGDMATRALIPKCVRGEVNRYNPRIKKRLMFKKLHWYLKYLDQQVTECKFFTSQIQLNPPCSAVVSHAANPRV